MNKEPKVLLNSLQNIVETIDIRPRSDNFTNINDSDIKLLLDYITNLEQEIKELRETTDRLTNKEYKKDDSHLGITRTKEQLERMQSLLCFKSKVEITDILIDTEEKIDKAIEFIKNTKVVSYEQDEVYLFKDIPEGYDLLNILQGSDKE